MGNLWTKGGDVDDGVRGQADAGSKKLYKLVNLGGGGYLVALMQQAIKTKDYSILDETIQTDVEPFLYNGGAGKKMSINDIVRWRMKADGGSSSAVNRSKGDGTAAGDMLDVNSSYLYQKPVQHSKTLGWMIDERGAVGETILHLCLLNSTQIHTELLKRLLAHFPVLIHDIYLGDMYYGENVLHMAIVNEDPAMVRFLLEKGTDVHQRCCGSFFYPDDQRDKRVNCLDHEWFDVPMDTNYKGNVYWGEFPLSFAAILGQEECVRLLKASGADMNKRDFNGNTVMHMLVIHDKKDMFDLLYDLGAKLNIKNRQGLTPLTLAAKLARKEMYDHILDIKRESYWSYGNVACAGYPLEDIDTISPNGEINPSSALSLIVYGNKESHLDMMHGLVVSLLQEKWKTFVKERFLRRLIIFILYFIMFIVAFALRPGTDLHPTSKLENRTNNGSLTVVNVTQIDPCYLMKPYSYPDIIRFVLESIVFLSSCIYLFLAIKEIYHQGFKIFFTTLRGAPVKALFHMSNIFVILMLPGRAGCFHVYEDVVAMLAILTTAPYCLFFCRGFKIVGPFVQMIYKMIKGDLLRFFAIYAIFVIGFSQAMYLTFLGVEGSIFSNWLEAVMGMFVMSLGEFGDIYDQFTEARHTFMAKTVFVFYMVLVTLLMVNMLIAMMGNTYQLVNNTQKEWFRQWAKIVLVVEQSVTTDKRREKQCEYSQPMIGDAEKRVLIIRWKMSDEERLEVKQIDELRQHHKENLDVTLAAKMSDAHANGNTRANMGGGDRGLSTRGNVGGGGTVGQ